jgi:hypothetical protein
MSDPGVFQLFMVSVAGSNSTVLFWKYDSFAMWQAIAAW